MLLALLDRERDLLSLVNATGVAVVSRDALGTRGDVPPKATLARLARWLDHHTEDAVFATASLASELPEAADVKHVASGLLTFSLPGGRRLMWFRPEVIQTVRWGGDPEKPVASTVGARLHPRRSFAAWQQEVQQQAERWSPSDLEAAEVLRREAVEAEMGRQLLRAQRAVRMRDDLVAVVSHDLRNPLSVARMQVAVLERAHAATDVAASRQLKPALNRITRTLDQMDVLIRDLLDLSKIEAGRFVLQRERVHVREVLEEGLLQLRPLAEAKGIALLDELVDDPALPVDRQRIFQVLSNLVGNAIKFTPEGGTITVRAERTHQGMRVSVTDTGPGLPPGQRERVFERYWQSPHTKGERGPSAGSGLGLFIARGIVAAHGGWIRAGRGAGRRGAVHLRAADGVREAPSSAGTRCGRRWPRSTSSRRSTTRSSCSWRAGRPEGSLDAYTATNAPVGRPSATLGGGMSEAEAGNPHHRAEATARARADTGPAQQATPQPSQAEDARRVRPPSPLAPYVARWAALPRGWRMLLGTGGVYGAAAVAIITIALTSSGTAWLTALATGVAAGLVSGLGFGLTMTLILGLAHVLGYGGGGARLFEQMSPRQTLRLHLAAPHGSVAARAEQALVSLGVAEAVSRTPDGLRLTASTRAGLRSFGEHVAVALEPAGSGTVVVVESHPYLPTTLVDYGKGRENVQQVADMLVDAFPVFEEPDPDDRGRRG